MKIASEASKTSDQASSSEEMSKLVSYEALVELAIFLIKTLITLNSGGAVVLLTFVGNAGQQELFTVAADQIKNAMLWFMAGLVFAVVMATLSYSRNFLIATGQLGKPRGYRVLAVYLFLILASLACFCIAVGTVAFSFSAAQPA